METILYVGLSNALVVLVLAPVAAGIRWVCRRPALTRSLWLLVLLKLVTPPLWFVHLSLPVPTPSADTVAPATLPNIAIPATQVERAHEPAEETLSDPPSVPAAPAAATVTWQAVVAAAWLTGSFLWAALAGWRWRRFHLLLRMAQPAPASLQDRARYLADRLGLRRCPMVVFVSGPIAPLLWAIGRARLLLPADLWPRLTDEQRDTLLVHELAHLRRRDHWVRCLELLVLALYWWHPVAWWARRELQEAEELCCDAWVVWTLPSAGPVYAEALVETVTFLSRSRTALPLGASGMGQAYFLKRRLTMIMDGTTPRTLSRLTLLTLLAVGAGLLPLAPLWGRQPPPSDPPPMSASEDPPSDPKPQPPALPRGKAKPGVLSEEAREELELLQARLDAKTAELLEAKARLTPAKLEIERLTRLKIQGHVSDTELARARSALDVLTAHLAGKEALVREAQVQLRQARRRLGLPITSPVAEPAPAAANERLKELEKKFDELHKELQQLRKELRSPQAGTTAPVLRIGTRQFRIPVQVDPERKRDLKQLILFVSLDEGKTWTQHAVASPDQKAFTFTAPKDGLYWFVVCTVDAQGRRNPGVPSLGTAPGLQVSVRTTKDAPKQADDKQVRVGQIIILGNGKTEEDVILKAVPIFSGQVLSYPDLRAAERNLEKLNLFEVNPKTGVRPKITVLDPDSDRVYKDILIEVKEKKADKP